MDLRLQKLLRKYQLGDNEAGFKAARVAYRIGFSLADIVDLGLPPWILYMPRFDYNDLIYKLRAGVALRRTGLSPESVAVMLKLYKTSLHNLIEYSHIINPENLRIIVEFILETQIDSLEGLCRKLGGEHHYVATDELAELMGISLDELIRFTLQRNPDDLERLEKIAEAREIYRETDSIAETARRVGAPWGVVKKWVVDLIPEKLDRYASLYEQGFTDKQIAEQLSVTTAAVKSWRRIRSLKPNQDLIKSRHRRQRIVKARKIYEEVKNFSKTAKRVGVSPETIKSWVKDLIPDEPEKPTLQERIAKAQEIYLKTGSIKETEQRVGADRRRVRSWLGDLVPKKETRIQQVREIY